ncbi:short-chain dehydrogenase [Aspergillus karnatakaensis]|uniref:short-chain dehydrogenase n=1 Tax=Aspergillus karnatakaensis TaxID=1810916 RepID=UPI003CCCBAE7
MSSYSFQTTGEQVAADCSASIRNKVILITGVSPGSLGAEFAITISKHAPALIILANRDVTKATETANRIKETSNVATRILKLDLASQSQVREAAAEVNGYEERIHVLVNNAGIMAVPHRLTPDGIESQFGTNHIGHFLFTNLIINKLLDENTPARVINVSSGGYRLGWVRLWDWNFDNGKTYDKWLAYGQSKTANMLFSLSLASKLSKRGLISVSLHPGAIQTNLGKAMGEEGLKSLVEKDRSQGHSLFWVALEEWSKFFKTIQQGIATHVYAAFHEEIGLEKHNGAYLDDCQPVPAEKIYSWGRDPVDAESLWKLSEEIVGEKFEY